MVTMPDKENTVIHECKLKVDLTKLLENHQFRFEFSFAENAIHDGLQIYRYTNNIRWGQPRVLHTVKLAATRCGDFHGKNQDCSKGIYIMAAQNVFRLAELPKNKSKDLMHSQLQFLQDLQ